ncbi:hypothetical protein BVC80_1825g35 [Macleaya cordata]|uniref:Endonuclease/exonuclease/phosphatase n=1 Tax=Macleaya cordata TaxID=56857 RepID=A0A200QZD1_MACCD|nr:hypothetical protein BVC80_1825g35 [Macleaya cordata]
MGGRPWQESDAYDLRRFASTWNLKDPGFSGPSFIWSNKQQEENLILERIDRVFINSNWENLFASTRVMHLPRISSDHSPILVCFKADESNLPKPFHFLSAWTKDPSCKDIIATSWNQIFRGSNAYKLKKKLNHTKHNLKRWNSTSFGNI